MATSTAPRPISDTIPLNAKNYDIPQVFALKFVTGKNGKDSQFPPFLPRVMFSTTDDRKLFLDSEDASDFERELARLRVQPGELVQAVMVKHAHGGGHSIRVARVSDAAEPSPSRLEKQLQDSVDMYRGRGATPARSGNPDPWSHEGLTDSRPPAPRREAAPVAAPQAEATTSAPPQITPASAKMMAALKAAIDAAVEATNYAKRLGLVVVPVEVNFNAEDIRTMANTLLMNGGR